ncbi:glycosyltransferase [Burkholderia sp. Ac-20353]|uniref:CgeB family protein n=1 Tax=Burkholderia sp. Ac-20353 TaxID=2703894 RepID=UPI00197BDB2D|nr:glycosyltransferase [Burkholderia sp. Ac-20353]MBN3789408.1 glycosyltransferase [Burkholderia sp. Ac-20353]
MSIETYPTIALVADGLTSSSLVFDGRIIPVGPCDYRWRLAFARPDYLLVESAWSGLRDRWKYKIAAYPGHPERTNRALVRLVQAAKDRGIPTVFWNKEDSVHFERFVASAKLFDHVFTVDANAVQRYKAVMGENASVHTLMFAIQPRTHGFTGFNFKHRRANFVGSYSSENHVRRRAWQDTLFGAACRSGLGLTVVDRNSGRKASHYRFPALDGLDVRHALRHEQTAQMYRDYVVSLNVNTVEDSPTMFSRRLVEILGCGGIAVTTPAMSVDAMFADFCHVVRNDDEARELFARLRNGPSDRDLERARAGAEHVAAHHTWQHRLQQIAEVLER